MKTKHIIIGLAILLIILFFVQKKEHAGSTPPTTTTVPPLSGEAVQNIAKVYADTNNEAVFNNIKTTGKVTGDVTGNLTGNVTGNTLSPNGQYYLSVDNNGTLSIRDKNNSNKVVWRSTDTVIARKAYGIKSPWHYLGNDNRSAYFGPEGPANAGYQQAMYIMPTTFENYKSEP